MESSNTVIASKLRAAITESKKLCHKLNSRMSSFVLTGFTPVQNETIRNIHEMAIKQNLKLLIKNIIHETTSHASLTTLMRAKSDWSNAEILVLILLWECENSIDRTLENMKDSMDIVDSVDYENQLLSGIVVGIDSVIVKKPHINIASTIACLESFNTIMKTSYIGFLTSEIKSSLQQEKGGQQEKVGGGGDNKLNPGFVKRKKKKSLHPDRLFRNNNQLIKGPRKNGKAILNRWRRNSIPSASMWNMGFNRQKIFTKLVNKK